MVRAKPATSSGKEFKRPRGRPAKNVRFVYILKSMDYVKKVDELNLQSGNLEENWKLFWQNFQIFATAIELHSKKEEVRVAVFLNAAGQDATEKFYTVINLTEEERKSYDKVTKAYEAFCKGKTNEVYESFLFHTRNQERDEPFDLFLMELKKLVGKCNFTDTDRMVRDRIVIGTNDKALQKKFLEVDQLTLQKTIEMARAAELSSKQVNVMRDNGGPSGSTAIDAMRTKREQHNNGNSKPTSKLKQAKQFKPNSVSFSKNRNYNQQGTHDVDCKFCAKVHQKGSCPAWGRRCVLCNGFNHFAIVCKKKSVSEIFQNQNIEDENVDEDNFYIDIISKKVKKCDTISNERESWFEKIRIQSQLINFKLDTGAQANILPYSLIQTMKNIIIEPNNEVKLEAYNGSEIETLGVCKLNCIIKNCISKQTFWITKNYTVPILD